MKLQINKQAWNVTADGEITSEKCVLLGCSLPDLLGTSAVFGHVDGFLLGQAEMVTQEKTSLSTALSKSEDVTALRNCLLSYLNSQTCIVSTRKIKSFKKV